MAATGYTPISLYYSTTASAVPTAGNLVAGELAININDGKLYFKNSSNVVTLLASSSGASGDVVGPASATDGGVALFDGTTGKLLKNSSSFVQVSGNVGIGTSSPSSLLSLYSASSSVVSTDGDITVQFRATRYSNDASPPNFLSRKSRGTFASPTAVNSGDAGGSFTTSAYGGTNFRNITQIQGIVDTYTSDTNISGYLTFATNSGSTAVTERMRITSAGNVGIGTTTVYQKLHVFTTGTTFALNLDNDNSAGDQNYISFSSGLPSSVGNIGVFFRPTATNTLQLNVNYGALVFGTGSGGTATERLRIDTSGNVGIGTNSPASLLHISGGALRGSNAADTLQLIGGVSGTANNIQVRGASHPTTPNIVTFDTNSAERMRIDSAGNVGIGTNAPTAQLQVAGNSSTSALKVPNIEEVATVSATAATGTINYDITTQSVLYYTSNASANWTVNFRGSSGTSLNTLMQTGESISVTFLVTQGSTAYYNSSVQVDGTTSGVTTKWQGGSAPTSGNASSIDSYTYVIIKTASATFTVLAAQTKFA